MSVFINEEEKMGVKLELFPSNLKYDYKVFYEYKNVLNLFPKI
jgi:hypothetical protein